MLKHKKFLSLLLIAPLFTMCAKPKEPFQVEKSDTLKITNAETAIPKKLKDGEKLPIGSFTVTFNDQPLTWLGENNKEYKTEGKFFVTTNATYPTNTIVINPKVTTNVESNDLIFYIACYTSVDGGKVFVSSQKYKVTITNANAIKPWVWYVVSGVVVFAVVAMVMFTRRYKAKKEGKI